MDEDHEDEPLSEDEEIILIHLQQALSAQAK